MEALKRWWRFRERQAAVPENAWIDLCARVALLRRYQGEARARLRRLSGRFLRKKEIRGARGLEISERMRLVIAAQACVPILNLGLGWYRGWHTVVVYPGDFVARHEYVDEAGVVHEVAQALTGESWQRGPLIVSWDGVQEAARGQGWGNVLIHEVAHKLDLLNGAANGMPPLHADLHREEWTAAFEEAFADLTRRVSSGVSAPVDTYAAEDPGECFAVMSEAFFVHPRTLRRAYPRVYTQLCGFYRQDPAA